MKHFLALALLLVATHAGAEVSRVVDHARLCVGDLLPGASARVREVEFGPAPPPGGSRLVSRDEVLNAIRRAGESTVGLRIPASMRITTASVRIAARDVEALVAPSIERALGRGVRLTRAEPRLELVLPKRYEMGTAVVPKPPRHAGPFRTTAMVEVTSDGRVVARVLVPVVLEVGEEAAHPDVARGGRIAVVIETGGFLIRATATALRDGNVGDVVQVVVANTGRTVRARLVSKEEARLVEGP